MTTNKNIVLTVNIDDPRHQFPPSLYAEYSINTWKSWCKKNNVDFKQIDVSVQQYDIAKWNKLCVFDVVEPHHEKIALVDCDTMIKWDAPNFFDSYDDEFCGVVDDGNIGWVKNSINIYKEFFPNQKLEPLEYINSGVMFFTKEHKILFDELKTFYDDNQDTLPDYWNKGGGTDQTIINYMLKKLDIKQKYLPHTWNLFGIHKKQMFGNNWQLQEDDTPFFIKYANIWHFTGFEIEQRTPVMRDVWETYGGKYE